jgi:hypothetical protein
VQLVMARSLGKRDINELINTIFFATSMAVFDVVSHFERKFRLLRGYHCHTESAENEQQKC